MNKLLNNIKISVVIPAYNAENYIKKTLNSVLNQTYNNYEIIVIDDGSKDSTKKIVNEITDSRIKYFYQENQGVSTARNEGVKKSNGEYIAFLDSDDFWKKEFLEECIEAIKKYPNINLFCTRIQNVYKNELGKINGEKVIKKIDKKLYIFNYYDIAYIQPIISMSSVIINKEAFLKVGGFNVNSYSGEDHEIYGKLGLSGDFCLVNRILSYYNKTSNNMILRKSCYPPLINFIDNNIENCYKEKKKNLKNVREKFILDYINGLIRREILNIALNELLKNYKIIFNLKLSYKYIIYMIIIILPKRIRNYLVKKIF